MSYESCRSSIFIRLAGVAKTLLDLNICESSSLTSERIRFMDAESYLASLSFIVLIELVEELIMSQKIFSSLVVSTLMGKSVFTTSVELLTLAEGSGEN